MASGSGIRIPRASSCWLMLATALLLPLSAASIQAESGQWLLRTFGGNFSTPRAVAVSPDESTIAVGYGDGRVRLWDAGLGGVVRTLEGPGDPVHTLTFSPDGTWLFAGGGAQAALPTPGAPAPVPRGFAWLYNAGTGEHLGSFGQHPLPGIVNASAVSPDGETLLIAAGGASRLWDVATGGVIRELESAPGVVNSAAMSADGSRVLTGRGNSDARLWDAATGELLRTFTGHQQPIRSVDFSPDGTRVLTGSGGFTLPPLGQPQPAGGVRLWDAETGEQLARIPESGEFHAASAAFSPDGEQVIIAGPSGTELWNATLGEAVHAFPDSVTSDGTLAFTPGGDTVLVGGSGQVREWDTATGTLAGQTPGHTAGVRSVAFSPDGALLVTASDDQTALVWETSTGAQLHTLDGHDGRVTSASFSPDGALLATGSLDGTIRLWNSETGAAVSVVEMGSAPVESIAFSPDGEALLAGGSLPGNAAQLLDAATGELIRSFTGHSAKLNSVAFSPDGALVMAGSTDATARIWNAETSGLVHVLEAHTHPVLTVAFSPDGSRLLTGGRDWTVRVWDTETGDQLRVFTQGPMNQDVSSVKFSPDGGLILSAGGFVISPYSGGSVVVRDGVTGNVLRIFPHDLPANSAVFSPDGTTILTGAMDGSVRLWDASGLPALAALAQLTEQLLSSSLAETSHLDANEDGALDAADVATLQAD